ncbi:MAG: protease inhibitor I42 family protein [Armatimonadetes bacterium]|nr:protease inhibitor I42 family protein [Armatimonadota bacterium]
MSTRLALAVACLALAAALHGCANAARQMQILTDQPQPARLVPGEHFGLVLRASPAAGMEWQLAEPLNEQIAVLSWRTYHRTNTFAPDYVPGYEGVETWVFQAVGPGEASVRMKYVRKGVPGAAPTITSDFALIVAAR